MFSSKGIGSRVKEQQQKLEALLKKIKRFLKTSNIPLGITVMRKSAAGLLLVVIIVRTDQLDALLTGMQLSFKSKCNK